MAWFLRSKKNLEKQEEVRDTPNGLWAKCPSCGEIIYKKQLEENVWTCAACDFHFRIGTDEYVRILFDDDTFVETETHIRSADPLLFVDTRPYKDRLRDAYRKTKSNDAITVGYGSVGGHQISFGSMNFDFVGGSMGAVVGEKFYRGAKRALKQNIPFLVLSASGGARMQEAALSLMQMAKTSSALGELADAGIPFISVLRDPTTGGVSASFAMLGDVIIAEPKALIGFAGPRVVEQTIRKKLPEGFQRSEFLLEKGFVDMIVHRKKLKQEITNILSLLN